MSFLTTTGDSTQIEEMELQTKLEQLTLEMWRYQSKINEIENKQKEIENQKLQLQKQRNDTLTSKEIFYFHNTEENSDNTQNSNNIRENYKLEKIKVFTDKKYETSTISFDGTKLAITQSNNDILIYDIKEEKLIKTISPNIPSGSLSRWNILKLQFHPVNNDTLIYIVSKNELRMWNNNEEFVVDDNINFVAPKISPNGNKIMYLKNDVIHIKNLFSREGNNILNQQEEIQVLLNLQYTNTNGQRHAFRIANYFWSNDEKILFIGGKVNDMLNSLYYCDIINRKILKVIANSIYNNDNMKVIPYSNIILYSSPPSTYFGYTPTQLTIKTDYSVINSKNINMESNIRDIAFCSKYKLIFVITETKFRCMNLEGTILFKEEKDYETILSCNDNNICILAYKNIIIYQFDKIEAKFAGKKI